MTTRSGTPALVCVALGLLAVSAGCRADGVAGSLPARAGAPREEGRLPIGLNLGWINYWWPEPMFLDLAKTLGGGGSGRGGGWLTDDGDNEPWDTKQMAQIPVDEAGYPLEIPSGGQYVKAAFNNHYPAGEYVVLYDGEGELAFFSGGAKAVSAAPGRVLITLTGDGSYSILRIKRSVRGNHVRNIRIVPESEEHSYQEKTFYPPYLEGLRPFHALRFMQTQNTNDYHSTELVRWADRRTVTDFTQESTPHKSVAIEYLVDLCNTLGCDAWFCIPHMADDEYIREFARLVKRRLDPSLKVYIEYSNEIWNWAYPYPQSHWVDKNAPGFPDEIQRDLAALPGFPEKDAYMMKRVFDIWLSEFSGEDRRRLVRVAAVQHGWPGNTPRVLQYLKDHSPPGDPGCDVVSPGGYFGISGEAQERLEALPVGRVTAEMIVQAAAKEFDTGSAAWTLETAGYARQFGVDYVVYEGGNHLDAQGSKHKQAFIDAQTHPAIYDLYRRNFRLHASPEVGCKLFMAYQYVSSHGSFGHLESVEQLREPETLRRTAPKYQALLDANAPRRAR